MARLTPSEEMALLEVSTKLQANPEHLFALIDFESKWNPQIKNPSSSARGLIQFMDRTARGMGYEGSADIVSKYPDRITQLKVPVYQYLKRYAPFPTKQSLYMAVFYPKARSWNLDREFPEWVQKANPNIDTVGDYVDFVDRHSNVLTRALEKKNKIILPVLIIAVGAAYLIFSKT